VGAILHPGLVLAAECDVQDYAIVGKRPKSSSVATLGGQAAARATQVGQGVTIGAQAIVYEGCSLGDQVFVGDQASIRENCTIGSRSVIGRGAMLEFDVRLGQRVLVFTGSYLCEKTTVEDDVFIGACVASAAGKVISYRRPQIETQAEGPTIHRGARIGTGTILHPGVSIGSESVVALGAVVFEDVPPGTLVLGNPARAIARVSESEYLPE
jgi:acetyltransferase-like isoleucine patch superfamily enzyme